MDSFGSLLNRFDTSVASWLGFNYLAFIILPRKAIIRFFRIFQILFPMWQISLIGPNYVLIFNPKCDLIPDLDHIIGDNLGHFPAHLQDEDDTQLRR